MNVPFVDLKAQYLALKHSIDKRIESVLSHGAFILGPEVEELEKELSRYAGVKHSITCASGTDALLMALMALEIGPGDEVITTCYSWISTAEVILLVGAKPVFVDVEPDTYNIDVEKIEPLITSRTKAIMPVSLFGQPSDMDEINALALKRGLAVIEDGAQSFGADYKGKKSCNLSLIGCTSFFPAKPLGCYGDGGAVFTNDDRLAKVLRSVRVHGQEERCYHPRVGINGRLDTIQCAILLAKLERFPWEIEQRQRIAGCYDEAFSALGPGVRTPVVRPDRKSTYAQYTLYVEQREAFQKALKEKGIPAVIYYPKGMHEHPPYECGVVAPLDVAEDACAHVVSLPMFADMSQETQDYIIEAVLSVFS